MKHLFKLFSLLVTMVLLVGCGAQQENTEEVSKVPVSVAEITLGNVEQSLVYNGDIEAEHAVKVFSKIPDRIEEFYVDDGDVVEKGQPLAKIFATTIEQNVQQAEAGLNALLAQEANLTVEYERANRLFNEGAMSKQQFDSIETQYKAIAAQVEQAKAGLRSAKASLEDATITAPIDGIVGKRYMEVGDMASPGMPLVEIVQMDRVKIIFDVTETDLGRIAKGQQANIRVKSYPDKAFVGEVVAISPILDPMTRMAEVEVLIDNPDGALKPGMFAEVTVITGVLENVISVPRFATIENTSLQRIDGENEVVKKYSVFVVQDGKAYQRELNVNYVNHISLAVDSGINVGDMIVVEGQNNLRDSLEVMIIQEENQL